MRLFRGNEAEEPIPLGRADSPEMPEVPVSVDFGPVDWESGATIPHTPPLSPRSSDPSSSSHPFNTRDDGGPYSRQTSSSHESYELATLPRQQRHNYSASIENITTYNTSLSEYAMESVEYTGNAGQAPGNVTQTYSSSDSPNYLSAAPVEPNGHVNSFQTTTLKRKRAQNDDGSSNQDRTAQSRYLLRSVTGNLPVLPSPSSTQAAPGRPLKRSMTARKGT
ncbi:hypothetical protein F4776DRAFT_667256 [Hypoxylon sp. NC0597]|nr:hypothetical protein F4776DRAFT_667256 [Hypoxylon sp. NC0597]